MPVLTECPLFVFLAGDNHQFRPVVGSGNERIDRQWTKTPGKRDLLIDSQRLIAKKDHQVIEEGLMDL